VLWAGERKMVIGIDFDFSVGHEINAIIYNLRADFP